MSFDHLNKVWNEDVDSSGYGTDDARAFREAQLKQYFKFVDSAEKVTDRRAIANTFFLSINSAIVTVFALFWKDRPALDNPWVLLLPLAAVLALCFTWYVIIRSYRQLNGAKWIIVGELEDRLPLRLWSTEWMMLESGTNKKKFLMLTVAEMFIPCVFATVYIAGFLTAVIAG